MPDWTTLKNILSKIFKTTIILFVITLPLAALADMTPVQAQQIQSLLNNWRARSGLPAAAMSIYLPGQNTPSNFVSGTTIERGNQPINASTLFQAGSITKSFTSMIILQLDAQGKLSLNDPITKYLPQYPQWRNVTIRELLNHTSGIFNYTATGTFEQIRKTDPNAGFTPDELVRMASWHHNYFAPGKGWKYSNTNYVLAGMIIAAVTHQSIEDIMNFYLHNNNKLSLPNTYYLSGIYSENFITRMAHGYSSNDVDVTRNNMSWAYTAGALVTNTQDLLAWWRGLFQGNVLPNQELYKMMSLVCEYTTAHKRCVAGQPMAHLQIGQINKGYGLGIIQSSYGQSDVGTVWWHNGSTQGYKALVMWFPKSNIYMSLAISRDPGYLLTPDQPLIRNVMRVLTKGSYTPSPTIVTHPHRTTHTYHHHTKRIIHTTHHKSITHHSTKHVVSHHATTKHHTNKTTTVKKSTTKKKTTTVGKITTKKPASSTTSSSQQ